MQTQQLLSTQVADFDRQVTCYCGRAMVVSRRDPSKDRYAVCSSGCWDSMVNDGNHELGTLFREICK